MTSQPTMLSLYDTVTSPNTDIAIPRLGFGVYQTPRPACTQACLSALAVGYRHIDSAQLYTNEAEVGRALLASGLPRSAVFLTTKICRRDGGADRTLRSVRESVRRMTGGDDGGYVDLFLVHRPCRERKALWQAVERLQAEGGARAVGVSNFGIEQLEEMREYAERWPPSVNQIELHPWCQQRELVVYCRKHSIMVQAWSPLVRGTKMLDPTLLLLGEKHVKTAAQVLVRYSLQKGWIPLVKSTSEERMKENVDVFDFSLDEVDMSILDGLDRGIEGSLCPHLIH
ncbi:hypothetical protein ACHAQH_003607 [Verticillium albo-atrum]